MTLASTLDELNEAARELLEGIADGWMTYYGGVVDGAGQPVAPPAYEDGRVKPYRVLWPDVGTLWSDRLSDDPSVLSYGFQITFAASNARAVLALVDTTRQVVTGARLPGITASRIGRLHETTRPGPPAPDPDTSPPRWSTPVLYQTTAT